MFLLKTKYQQFKETIVMSSFDITGKLVLKNEVPVSEQQSQLISLPVTNLQAGIYFLQLKTASEVVVKKVVK